MIQKIKLGDVLDIKRGPGLSGKFYSEKGTKIRLTLGNFKYPECGFKNNESKKDIFFTGTVKPEYILKKGDIITPLTEQVRGLLGNTATIPEDNLYIQNGDVGLVVPNEKIIDKRFAYYLMSSSIVKNQLDAGSQQTKIRHTSPDKIKDCIAYMPENKMVQSKIAKTLDDIDNKKNNNNKINAELEEMAKTLYDYWFLQFEFPNEEGKPYKSSGGKMVYNEELKREIPEGWEVNKVGECIEHINTGLNPRNHFVLNDGTIKYVTVKNITKSGTLDFSGCDTINQNTKAMINNRSKISKGDILFSSIAPLGRCYLIESNPENWEINESVFSIRPNQNVSSEYLYMYFMSDAFIKNAEHSSTGSIFSGIRISTLQDMEIVVPSTYVKNTFISIISNMFVLKDKLSLESEELTSLRDFLLPMLMNGQVTIKN